MISDGNEFVSGAIVVGGFAPYPPHPFLVLIQEKGAKENQAPTGGGEVGRVQELAGVVFSEVCRVREGAGVVFSDGGGRAKKIPAKRLDGGNLRVVANDGMDYVGDSASGAFRSKMERRM